MCCKLKKIFLELKGDDALDEEHIEYLTQNLQLLFEWTRIQAETVITIAIGRGRVLLKESPVEEIKQLTPKLVEARIPFTVEDSPNVK